MGCSWYPARLPRLRYFLPFDVWKKLQAATLRGYFAAVSETSIASDFSIACNDQSGLKTAALVRLTS